MSSPSAPNTILSASSAKRKAHYPISKIQISCHVNDTELNMDFDYFPSSAQLQQVVCFLMEGALDEHEQPPILIDATITEPYFRPICAPEQPRDCISDSSSDSEEEECDHQRVKCGKFYGAVCAGTPATDLEHHHVFMDTCGYCLLPKESVNPTGNDAAFICIDCCVEHRHEGKACNWCVECSCYEDLNDYNLCQKCADIQISTSFHDARWDLTHEPI